MTNPIILTLLLSTSVVHGKRVAPPPVAMKVIRADCVVVGTVVRMETKLIKLARYPGGSKIDHQVAIIKVEKTILSDNPVTHIRVASLPGVTRLYAGYGVGALIPKATVCLYLKRAPKTTCYQAINYYDALGKDHPAFQKEVKQAEKYGKFLQQPMKYLQGKDANERLLTAVLLINRYRTSYYGKTKPVPIDAKVSRFILKTLSEADWKKGFPDSIPGPINAFRSLGLTKADGWTNPNSLQQFEVAAKAWLKNNQETYRIKRLTPETN